MCLIDKTLIRYECALNKKIPFSALYAERDINVITHS